jgi:hypothetical protein
MMDKQLTILAANPVLSSLLVLLPDSLLLLLPLPSSSNS